MKLSQVASFRYKLLIPHRTTSNSETCSPLPELINLLSSLCFEDKSPLNWVTLCYQRRLSPSSKMAGLELAVCWLHSFIVLCCQAGHRVESSRNGGGKEMKAIRTRGRRSCKWRQRIVNPWERGQSDCGKWMAVTGGYTLNTFCQRQINFGEMKNQQQIYWTGSLGGFRTLCGSPFAPQACLTSGFMHHATVTKYSNVKYHLPSQRFIVSLWIVRIAKWP